MYLAFGDAQGQWYRLLVVSAWTMQGKDCVVV